MASLQIFRGHYPYNICGIYIISAVPESQPRAIDFRTVIPRSKRAPRRTSARTPRRRRRATGWLRDSCAPPQLDPPQDGHQPRRRRQGRRWRRSPRVEMWARTWNGGLSARKSQQKQSLFWERQFPTVRKAGKDRVAGKCGASGSADAQ